MAAFQKITELPSLHDHLEELDVPTLLHKINEEDALESLKLIREAASLIFQDDKQK